MAFNVQEFRSALRYDGARPNLFQFNMTFPTVATGGGATGGAGTNDNLNVNRQFSFMARAGQMPGSSINPIPVMYFGRELKFAGNRVFPEWTVTIINDEDFRIKNSFEKWLSGLNSHVNNERDSRFINPNSYTSNIDITQFSKTGPGIGASFGSIEGGFAAGIKQYRLIGAFPIDVSPIELDWGANDQIEEFTVTFAYQWWESNTTEQSYVGA
jgi:hypothetical protein